MNAVITGSRNGLGAAIADVLGAYGHYHIIHYDKIDGNDVRFPKVDHIERCDVLINNAGINHIDWLENFDQSKWDDVIDTNAKGIYMMTKALLPKLIESKGTVVNIISNAAHIPMTCSLAYNASKGAAHIMTLQLARELTKKYGITVFGVAPNKLKGTKMSEHIDKQVVRTRGWTEEHAKEYQLNALLTGEETPPRVVAEFIGYLLSEKRRHHFLSGCVIPYGA